MGKEQIFLQGQVIVQKGYIDVILEVILKVKNLPKAT